jgi:hypothetical protein
LADNNNTAATATLLTGTDVKITGNFGAAADVDYYVFSAKAGDRVYAATMTSFSTAGSDTLLDIIGPDGTTVLETDDDDGTFASTSSTIAGTVLSTSGTYYARVRNFSSTSLIFAYDLWLRVQSGTPTAETESNDTFPG